MWNKCPNKGMTYERRWAIRYLETGAKRHGNFWGRPKQFDHGHFLMWLCQMVYAEVILGIEIDWTTIPHTNGDLKAMHRFKVIPSVVLGHNGGRPIPSAWQPPTHPPEVPFSFDFLATSCHQPPRIPPSNPKDTDNVKTVLGIPMEPPTMQ